MTAKEFLEVARQTGVEIGEQGPLTLWQGRHAGRSKPAGPLSGKTVGIPVASEFSDFQAYYLTLYITELGGKVEFLGADWITWKNTRPTSSSKGVIGMWGLSLDPIPILADSRQGYKSLAEAKADRYDALVFLGGHSADILMTDKKVLDLTAAVYQRGAVIGAIGAGSLPLIHIGILDGKKATGNSLVSYLIEKTGRWVDTDVVRDGSLITAADTANTPAFLRELGRAFDGEYRDPRKGVLAGKKVLIAAGEDFEDIELVVPTMEFLYRGAQVCLASYPPPLRARPPLLGLDVVCGNFGVSIPLQEIPAEYYRTKKLNEVEADEYDLLMIPGAFNPWNMVSAGQPLEFLKRASEEGKIIAPICHGPIPLAAADLVQGKHLAGTGACEKHITIMGGSYSYAWSAVVDGGIVSGREPADLPEFLDAMTFALLEE